MEYTERTKAEQIANAYFDMGAGWSASGGLLKELREMEDGYIKQLTQRTAELEAAKQKAAEQGRYAVEMFDEVKRVQAELERVRGELVEATHNVNVYQSLYSTGCMDRALLENDLRELRTLIAALPKVEGEITANRVCTIMMHGLYCEEFTKLLQHRQGME